ncbi:MAG: hypothetical protein V2I33_14720 [Kangiellaceae bacterium]|jgi:hypothetical protein|nr:hypothetical protein [Kangiellaceae bacterium]
MKLKIVLIAFLIFLGNISAANNYTYEKISKRNKQSALSKKDLANAKVQGECLVGLKELNFKRMDKFDPVAEWTNYRSISLLEQYSPCEVLVMMEAAKEKLTKAEKLK